MSKGYMAGTDKGYHGYSISNGPDIDAISWEVIGTSESQEDAYEFAAASDLKEALEAFVAVIETAPPMELIKYISDAGEMAKAALTKSNGEK